MVRCKGIAVKRILSILSLTVLVYLPLKHFSTYFFITQNLKAIERHNERERKYVNKILTSEADTALVIPVHEEFNDAIEKEHYVLEPERIARTHFILGIILLSTLMLGIFYHRDKMYFVSMFIGTTTFILELLWMSLYGINI